jgi:hypothetical protein
MLSNVLRFDIKQHAEDIITLSSLFPLLRYLVAPLQKVCVVFSGSSKILQQNQGPGNMGQQSKSPHTGMRHPEEVIASVPSRLFQHVKATAICDDTHGIESIIAEETRDINLSGKLRKKKRDMATDVGEIAFDCFRGECFVPYATPDTVGGNIADQLDRWSRFSEDIPSALVGFGEYLQSVWVDGCDFVGAGSNDIAVFSEPFLLDFIVSAFALRVVVRIIHLGEPCHRGTWELSDCNHISTFHYPASKCNIRGWNHSRYTMMLPYKATRNDPVAIAMMYPASPIVFPPAKCTNETSTGGVPMRVSKYSQACLSRSS